MLKRLFTYGTRTEVPADCTVLGLGTIRAVMHNLGRYPGCIPHPEKRVVGQVLSFIDITDEEWERRLKYYDGYEGGLYRREQVEVDMGDGTTMTAWIYLYCDEKKLLENPFVPSGDWQEVMVQKRERRKTYNSLLYAYYDGSPLAELSPEEE